MATKFISDLGPKSALIAPRPLIIKFFVFFFPFCFQSCFVFFLFWWEGGGGGGGKEGRS